MIIVKILKMFCEFCLKSGKKIGLIRFSDAYSCPCCYLVSNEIVFGNQSHNANTFFSYDCDNWSNIKLSNIEKINN